PRRFELSRARDAPVPGRGDRARVGVRGTASPGALRQIPVLPIQGHTWLHGEGAGDQRAGVSDAPEIEPIREAGGSWPGPDGFCSAPARLASAALVEPPRQLALGPPAAPRAL